MRQNSDRTILIASSAPDKPAWGPVANELCEQGFDVRVWRSERVASGNTPFDLIMTQAGGLAVKYDGRELSLPGISAAWYREPNYFVSDERDWATQLAIDISRRETQAILWQVIRERAWLNPPDRLHRAQYLLGQLMIARAVGFRIPTTIASNSWSTVTAAFPWAAMFMTPVDTLYDSKDGQIIYATEVLDTRHPSLMIRNPYPGFWQAVVGNVRRDWHITMVGDRAFDAVVYRPHRVKGSNIPRIEYAAEQFPDDMHQRCWKYLGLLGLQMGTFRFAENGSGLTFLGLDSNGHYGWQEERLGQRISHAVAGKLGEIALRG